MNAIITPSRRFRTLLGLTALGTCCLLLANERISTASSKTQTPETTTTLAHAMRIGTYDSRAIVMAYARSPQFAAKMKDLQRQRAEATKAGDTRRVAELNTLGESMQVRLNMQGFSVAPVDDVLDTVRGQLPELAKANNVVAIAASVDYHDVSIEIVDVTDALVSLFTTDKQALKAIADLRKQKPLPLEQVARMPANP
jgi:hypothetical protein